MNEYTRKFFNLALQKKALLFGNFTTKAGRQSPYFSISALLPTEKA